LRQLHCLEPVFAWSRSWQPAASVSNQVPQPQLGLVIFGSTYAQSRSLPLVLPLPLPSWLWLAGPACTRSLRYDTVKNRTRCLDWRQYEYSMTIGFVDDAKGLYLRLPCLGLGMTAPALPRSPSALPWSHLVPSFHAVLTRPLPRIICLNYITGCNYC